MIIRPETESDIQAIYNITKLAFAHHPHSNQTEQFIVNALRAADALTISLVAEIDGRIVGHIAFSPARIDSMGDGWYGLGPISVLPEYQKQGIGQALIAEGLARLRKLGAQGCVLVGDPDYYRRLGFKNYPGLTYDAIPQEFVMAYQFTDTIPVGSIEFHQAFSAQS